MNNPFEMANRPPVRMICYIDSRGNPFTYTVGSGVTEIREVQESGENSYIPWVEVWNGSVLVARFNQHKLEHIVY